MPAQHGPSACELTVSFAELLWPSSAIVNIEKVALVVSLEDALWSGVERPMTSNGFGAGSAVCSRGTCTAPF